MIELEAVVHLQQCAKEDADLAAEALLKFLYANADDYATWKASPFYIDPNAEEEVVCSEDEIGGILM